MEFVGFLVFMFVWGLVVGALARFALPGPDPLSIWWTAALGVSGSLVGGLLGMTFFGTTGGLLLAVVAATALLALYRRFVQKRPITGPGARRS